MIRAAAPAAFALVLGLAAGCDLFTPRPPRGTFTPAPSTGPTPGCEVCGTSQRSGLKVFRVEAPATLKAGQAATFTFYAVTGLDKAVICEVPLPRADQPGWGVDAGAKTAKLGVAASSVIRDESRPCAVVDRAAPPKALRITRSVTFPEPGTYALEVAGYDATRPLGLLWSPGPGDPPAPPAPSAPATIEVQP